MFTNWTLSDPRSVLPLKVAGPGSVRVGSRDFWASFTGTGTGWSQQAGFYLGGFARLSANPTDHVMVTYSCQYTHTLLREPLTFSVEVHVWLTDDFRHGVRGAEHLRSGAATPS